MVAKNKTVSKDEKFILEDSQPQASFTAHNGKNVSTRQGEEVIRRGCQTYFNDGKMIVLK